MKKLNHTAFYLNLLTDKEWLINQIMEDNQFHFNLPVKNLKGEIFSNSKLEYFLEEEIRHDHFEISLQNNNRLSFSSSGEQRKAVLKYIIEKKPDYLIIDNVFDSLDQVTRGVILSTLIQLESTTLIIQLFNRRDELLPFIENVYSVQDQLVTRYEHPGELWHKKTPIHPVFPGIIPSPLSTYTMPEDALVRMNNVSVHYDGRPILQNICWQINAGEFWQLTGPNGSGKSTLLSLITGNSPKGYGQDLFLFGHRKGSGETVWQIKENIGYFTPTMSFQFERQDSIEQMIISGFYDSVGLYIKPSDRQVQVAGEWLHLVGLYPQKDQPFRLFSEGHQRMILIARAMIKHPPLLILDEPSNGLDDEMAALFVSLINKIAAETTTAILYVSHRKEKGLNPARLFNLSPTAYGSTGKIVIP